MLVLCAKFSGYGGRERLM